MPSDLTPLDQEVHLLPAELLVLDKVDETITKSLAAGDPNIAFGLINALRRSTQVAGISAAKLFSKMKDVWDVFATDETFEDYASAETGYSPQTIRKYCDAWEYVINNDDVPEKLRSRMFGKTWGSILLMAPAAKADELTTEVWEELAAAPDKATVRNIIHEVRGNRTSSNTAIKLFLYTRGDNKGQLVASKEDKMYPIGYLDLDSADTVVVAAITRIMGAAGVLEI